MKLGTFKDGISVFGYLIKIVLLYVFSLILTWSTFFLGDRYLCEIIQCGGFIDLSVLVWLLISFPFSLSLIFTLFGDRYKYFWIIGTLIIILGIFRPDKEPTFFLMIVSPALIGWGMGVLISKFLQSRHPTSVEKKNIAGL